MTDVAATSDRVSRLGSTLLASDRFLPVDEAFSGLFGGGGLVRGQTVGCGGPAGVSVMLALASRAVREGSWLALIDLPWLGLDAAVGFGVALERVVSVTTSSSKVWADSAAAAADGFDLIATSLPAAVSPSVARRVQQRVRSRGATLLVAAPSTTRGDLPMNLTVETHSETWEGLGEGHGVLQARRVRVAVTGRRAPHRREVELWLPAPGGGVVFAADDQREVVRPLRDLAAS